MGLDKNAIDITSIGNVKKSNFKKIKEASFEDMFDLNNFIKSKKDDDKKIVIVSIQKYNNLDSLDVLEDSDSLSGSHRVKFNTDSTYLLFYKEKKLKKKKENKEKDKEQSNRNTKEENGIFSYSSGNKKGIFSCSIGGRKG